MSVAGSVRALFLSLGSTFLLAFSAASESEAPPPAQLGSTRPVSVDSEPPSRADEGPHNWAAHGRTASEQRHSPLSQIDRSNISRLGLAWSYSMGSRRGLEATPLVVDGVLYVTGTWSVVHALDATTGKLLWRYDPQVPGPTARKACCDVVNRGVAVWRDRVYLATLDGRLVSLDATTGHVEWEVMTVDPRLDYTITGAPRVVRGKVIIGNSGAEFGVRGYFGAYDADTGALLWRFYTVPGDPSQGFEHPELALAATTWSPDSRWETGLGGTVWDSMAYDPELDLLYVGVGNGSPYPQQARSPGGGDNLFLSSILAVRPDTGRRVWHYQTTPGESWDYTATQHMILIDIHLDGELRKVLVQAPKNGFFYVLDRATGELLSATPYVPTNWATHVDLATGRPVVSDVADWSARTRRITPGPPGGHNWQPMSYHPGTGLVYIPTIQLTYPFIPDLAFRHRPGQWNTGESLPGLLDFVASFPEIPFCAPTQLVAWDPVAQKAAWRVDHDFFTPAGVLSTAGGLVFQGTGGRLVAYAADTGQALWESITGVGITAPPISYAVDGVQYIAVLAGLGGGSLAAIPVEVENDGRLLVYALDGRAPMPSWRPREPGRVEAPEPTASPAVVARGRALYADHCMFCHGFGARSGGMLPDLRLSKASVHREWQAIVLGGVRQARGMASFADVLDAEAADSIHAYVIDEAHREPTWMEWAGRWLGEHVCMPVEWIAD